MWNESSMTKLFSLLITIPRPPRWHNEVSRRTVPMLFPSSHFTQWYSLHLMPLVPGFLSKAVSISSINLECLSQIVFGTTFEGGP